MKLFLYEIKKLLCDRRLIVMTAALLLTAAVVCFITVNDAEAKFSGAASSKAIDAFVERYSDDPEGLTEFERQYHAAVLKRMEELIVEYGEADRPNDSNEPSILDSVPKHPELIYTYTFSPYIPDKLLISAFEETMGRLSEYRTGVVAILSQARTNMERLKKENNADLSDPLYQYQAYVYIKYENVRDNAVVGNSAVCGWDKLFTYSYGEIFLFAALILFANSVFIPEKQRGMLPLLRVSKRGRLDSALAKVILLMLGSTLLSLFFALIPFFTVLFTHGYSDPGVSVQNIRELALFPEVWTIKRYFIFGLLMKLLSGAAFGLLSGLISLLTYNLLFSLSSGAALFGMLFACSRLDTARFPLVHALNPYSLSTFLPISDRLYVVQPNLTCISLLELAPIACAAILLISASACVLLFANKRPAVRNAMEKLSKKLRSAFSMQKIRLAMNRRPGRRRAYTPSLFRWELRKQLFFDLPILLAVILLFTAWTGMLASKRIKSAPGREYRIYKTFLLSETEGAFSENRELYSLLLAVYSSPNIGNELLAGALESGAISKEQHDRFASSLERVIEGSLSDNFDFASELYSDYSLLAENGAEPYFTDIAEVLPLLGLTPSYPLYAAILLVLIGAFLKERNGKDGSEHFVNILRSTKNGRRSTFRAKFLSGLLLALLLGAVFYSAEYLILTLGKDMRSLSAPLCSVTEYSGVSTRMSIGGYLAFLYGMRLMACLLLAAFTIAVSALSNSLTSAFALMLGTTMLPTLLYKAGLKAVGYASFGSFFGVNELMLFSEQTQLLSSSFGALFTFAAAFAAVTALLTAAAYRKFNK